MYAFVYQQDSNSIQLPPLDSSILVYLKGENLTDSSSYNRTLELGPLTAANPIVDNTQSRYGEKSLYFPNTSNISATNFPAAIRGLNIPGDFTIEFWIKSNGSPQINSTNVLCFRKSNEDITSTSLLQPMISHFSSQLRFWRHFSYTPTFSVPNTTNWIHLAVCRKENIVRIYRNGIFVSSTLDTTGLNTWTDLLLGTRAYLQETENNKTNFYLNNFIISNKVLYSSNFLPSKTIKDTNQVVEYVSQFILDLDILEDTSNHKYTAYEKQVEYIPHKVNSPSISTSIVKWQKSLFIPNQAVSTTNYGLRVNNCTLSSGQFTIEFWLYAVSTPALFICDWRRSTSLSSQTCLIGTITPGTITTDNIVFGIGAFRPSFNFQVSDVGVWTHLAVTRDSSNVVRIFKNGTLQNSGSNTTNLSTEDTIFFGNVSTPGAFYIEDFVITHSCKYIANYNLPNNKIGQVLKAKANIDNLNYKDSIMAFEPFLYCPMNETSGTVLNDVSEHRRNGIYRGTVDYTAAPLVAQDSTSIQFSGGLASSGVINTNIPDTVRWTKKATSFTIMLWCRLSTVSQPASATIIAEEYIGGSDNIEFSIVTRDNWLTGATGISDFGYGEYFAANWTLFRSISRSFNWQAGQNYFIVITQEGASTTIVGKNTIYVNGKKLNYVVGLYGKTTNSIVSRLLIASNHFDTSPNNNTGFQGSIGHIAIIHSALKPQDILNLYRKGAELNISTATNYEIEVEKDKPLRWWSLEDVVNTTTVNEKVTNTALGTVLGSTGITFRSTPIVKDSIGSALFTTGTNTSYIELTADWTNELFHDYSVECWVNITSSGTRQAAGYSLVTGKYISSSTTFNYSLDYNNDFLSATQKFSIGHVSGSQWRSAIMPTVYNLNQTYHVVGIKQDNIFYLYVNGIQVSTGAAHAQFFGTNPTILFGRGQDSFNPGLETCLGGRMSHITLYDYALSPERILAHYNAGVI